MLTQEGYPHLERDIALIARQRHERILQRSWSTAVRAVVAVSVQN
jgi:hypothetical protein